MTTPEYTTITEAELDKLLDINADLLAALEAVVWSFGQREADHPDMVTARAAIAKATT